LGAGRVGRAFLQHAVSRRAVLQDREGVRLCIAAVADSSGIVAADDGEIDDAGLRHIVSQKAAGGGLVDASAVVDDLRPVDTLDSEVSGYDAAPILVDATASDTSASLMDAVAAGWRIALANKMPLTGPYRVFEQLTQRASGARWETTVASALPVAAVLGRLVDQGEVVQWITATLSGTLGHLTERLSEGGKLSESVAQAVREGLAEPDPRSDLTGADTARKALILARMVGLELELTDVATESLTPPAWRDLDASVYLERLTEMDGALADRFADAHQRGAVLRYGATIGEGAASAGWITVDDSAPLARVCAGDSAVMIETHRFRARPIVISGRAGGPVTTAAGLMADVIELARA
jgi:homoserine dehydrogenase